MLLTSIDHRQFQEEAEADPAFGRKLQRMLEQPDGTRKVDESAMRAILNELNPRDYPGSRGEWKVLRRRFRAVLRGVKEQLDQEFSNLPLHRRVEKLESYTRRGVRVSPQRLGEYPVESLGQWEAIVGAVAAAATSVYSAKLQSQTAKELAKIQQAGEMRQLEANMTLARAQMALDSARLKQIEDETARITSGAPATSVRPGSGVTPGAPGTPGAGASGGATAGGTPGWVAPAVAAAVVGGAVLLAS